MYAKKEWHAFETILQNGDVEVFNNASEREIRRLANTVIIVSSSVVPKAAPVLPGH